MDIFEFIFTILFCVFYLFHLNIILFLSFLASFWIIFISFYFLPSLTLGVFLLLVNI